MFSEVIVLIPHYNNPKGLLKSIQSIDESGSIDVLIIDDGSKEEKIEENLFINKIANNVKLFFIFFKENQGIEYALNEGLNFVKRNDYQYIARLDCGDICEKNRFKIQREFLLNNPDIGLVGSFVRFFDTNDKYVYDLKLPTKDNQIRNKMFLNSMFIHPTIMITKNVLEKVGEYSVNYEAAEDYAFFFDILKHFRGANIDKFLVHCEINSSGISVKKRKKQISSRIRLVVKNFDFGFYAFYGLLRNLILYIIPYKLVLLLKSIKK